MCKFCSIIPKDVLLKLSKDHRFSTEVRQGLADTAKFDNEARKIREQARRLTSVSASISPGFAALAAAPSVTVYDCRNTQTLPGQFVANPAASADTTVNTTFATTTAVASFYQQIFGRNSIDAAGMTMQSSVHYGVKYNNAFWNGFQMTYGDGDGAIFVDFSRGPDVVCHELTHGVTQHSLRLSYTNEAGGLNESASDVFGIMFKQWYASTSGGGGQLNKWLIGDEIMGPQATSRGYTCLRDMAKPDATHCLAPQIVDYKQFTTGMDPHYSSGVANFAFYKIATAIGGDSWGQAGQIWYRALTGFRPAPNMKMKRFADRTRRVAAQLYPGDARIASAVDTGWKQVSL